MVKITYFVHGMTTDNEKELSSGWNDVELSARGVKQSIELGEKINPKSFDIAFCSDLKRAVESTKLIFTDVVPIKSDRRLCECNYGNFNGKPAKTVDPMHEQNIDKPFPNGESLEDVKKRISDFLNEIKVKYDGKHIAIVAHKVPQYVLDVLLKGMTWQEAFANDWRMTDAWQPGWDYEL